MKLPALLACFYLASLASCSNESEFNSRKSNKEASSSSEESAGQDSDLEKFGPGVDPSALGKDTKELEGDSLGDSADLGDSLGSDAEAGDTLGASEIYTLCSNAGASLLTSTTNLDFPPTQNCPFGEGDNLSKRQAYYQARVEVARTFNTPADSIICSFQLISKTEDIQYDDVVVITLNDYILATSNKSIYPNSVPPRNISKWSFDNVRGTPMPFETPQSCIGEPESVCKMPGHDRRGGFELSFEGNVLAPLSAQLMGKEEKKLSVITLGDNDEGDCEHTGIEFDVVYTYIKRP